MKKRSPLLPISLLLSLIGLFFIAISSLSEASSTAGDKFFFLKKQLIWIPLSLVAFYISSKIDLKLVKKYATPLYFLSIALLILVFIPGFSTTILGAKRWLNLGFFAIQPSEIFKLSAIIFFSSIFSKVEYLTTKNLLIYLLPGLLLIILEPNLSTTILVTAIVFTLFYIGNGNILSIFSISSVALILGIILIVTSPYRQARLQTLLNPESNDSTSYHSQQITIGLASGGIAGKGLANSDQKYKFLPKLSTDSILAVIGEETGFIGILLIIYLYLLLIFQILKSSRLVKDPFYSLILTGIASWIAYQSLINIFAIASLIPLTGVPLPFVSYGGSSLLTLFAALGIARNIERQELSSPNHQKTTSPTKAAKAL